MWSNRAQCVRDCFSGHHQGNFSGVPRSKSGQQVLQSTVSPIDVTLVTTINNKLATVNGELCGTRIDIMLYSGSSVPLIREEVTRRVQGIRRLHSMNVVNLATASGDALPILDRVKATIQFQNLESPLLHDFLVVKDLVAPVILGVHFLHLRGLVLDFTSHSVKIHHGGAHHPTPQSASTVKAAIQSDESSLKELEMDRKDNKAEEDSTVPDFEDTGVYVMPEYTDGAFGKVIQTYRDLFRNTPGKTTLAQHYIPTSGPALKGTTSLNSSRIQR